MAIKRVRLGGPTRRNRGTTGNIKITKKGIIIAVFLGIAMFAVALGLTFSIMESHERKVTTYNRALKLENEDQILHAYQTQAGLTFASGVITKIQHGVTLETDIKGSYAYIRRIREEYRQTDDDDWEWVYMSNSDATGYAQGNIKFGKIELPASAFITSEYLTLTRQVLNLGGGRITENGKYIEFNGGLFNSDYRYSYQVIEFDQNYSTLVNFNGDDLKDIRLYKKTVQKLYEDMTSFSAVGIFIGIWLGLFLFIGLIIFLYYAVKRKRLEKKQARVAKNN